MEKRQKTEISRDREGYIGREKKIEGERVGDRKR